jgi:hypothetical protein
MNSTMNRKTYAGIDVWKFIMAFAVIAIHSRGQAYTFGQYSECITWIISLAVPFFFIVSGFLLAQKLDKLDDVDEKRDVFLARSKQMCRLYISWLIVYLPIAIYVAVINDAVWYKAIPYYISQVLFYGQSAYAWPLWYIYSMSIVCYLIYKFFYKSRRLRVILSTIFFVAALIASFKSIPNLPVIGFPNTLCSRSLGGGYLILSGMYLYKYKHLMVKLRWALFSLIVSVILFSLSLPFSPLFGGIAIFIFAMLIPLKGNPLTNIMRKQSMWIYYLHMYFVFTCFEIFRYLSEPLHVVKAFVIASIVTFLSTRIIVGLTNRGYCVWLNNLVK